MSDLVKHLRRVDPHVDTMSPVSLLLALRHVLPSLACRQSQFSSLQFSSLQFSSLRAILNKLQVEYLAKPILETTRRGLGASRQRWRNTTNWSR